jgi:hypothetical protein
MGQKGDRMLRNTNPRNGSYSWEPFRSYFTRRWRPSRRSCKVSLHNLLTRPRNIMPSRALGTLPTTGETYMKTSHIAALVLLSWTLVINIPRAPAPETKTGFPTKQACEQAAAKWRANFETQVKEGTIRTDTDRRRRLARAIPSTKCIEDTKTPPVNP